MTPSKEKVDRLADAVLMTILASISATASVFIPPLRGLTLALVVTGSFMWRRALRKVPA